MDANSEPLAATEADTLRGDVRDFLLSRIRTLQTPWATMSEDQQRSTISDCDHQARRIVDRAVGVVAERGFDQIRVTLGKFTVKDGLIKGEVTCQATDENMSGFANTGQGVLVLADPNEFMGQTADAKPDPDQRNLLDEPEMDPGDKPVFDNGDVARG